MNQPLLPLRGFWKGLQCQFLRKKGDFGLLDLKFASKGREVIMIRIIDSNSDIGALRM